MTQIDGVSLREVEHQFAVNRFHAASNVVTLLVERGAEQRILVSYLLQLGARKQQSNNPRGHTKGVWCMGPNTMWY